MQFGENAGQQLVRLQLRPEVSGQLRRLAYEIKQAIIAVAVNHEHLRAEDSVSR